MKKFEKKYERYFTKTSGIIKEPWRFIGANNLKEEVNAQWLSDCKVEYEDIYGSNVEIDLINVISDFYYVVGLSNRDNITATALEKISRFHKMLLWLKQFYLKELRKCLDNLEEQRMETNLYYFWYKYYSSGKISVYDICKYLIENIDNRNRGLEKIFMICILYSLIFGKDYRWYISFFSCDNIFTDREDFWGNIDEKIVTIFKSMNSKIEDCESCLLSLKIDNLVEWEEIYNLEEIIYNFEKALHESQCKKEVIYKDVRCCGIMEIGVKKYFTINGIKDNEIVKESNIEKIISVLEKILGNAVYVNISDDTRYYLENESYITYKDYILDESENKNNRMFTCCERKLLSKFFKMKVNDTEIKIVTTKLPCLLCKRTINIIEKRTKFRISVVCGESELSKEMVQEMDSIASNILSISSKK